MSQILSQEEIDALLGGLDEAAEEEVRPTHAAVEEDETVSYDFENSARLTRVKFPAFDIIHDQFNRGLRTTLSSILRLMVDTAVAPIEIVTFREFLRRVPVPSNLHILKMDPLRGHVMMVVDSQLVFCIVEVFLGSIKIGKARVEGREFTSIEQRLIQRVATSLFSDMEKAWQLIFPITIQYIRSEINPQFAKIAQDDDTCIISRFRIDLEEVNGSISICIPLSVLQPIKAKLQSTFQADEVEDPAWRDRLVRNLRTTELNVNVPLGNASISGAELLDLTVGDIIQLDTAVDGVLPVLIQGQRKFLGHPGLSKGQRAVRVAGPVTE
jgi:flagellar motor switch protein FliM